MTTRHARRCITLSLLLVAIRAATQPGAATPPPAAAAEPLITQIRYEGALWMEGHLARPGELRPYHSRQSYFTDGRRVRLDWVTWEDGDTLLQPESFLAADGRLLHRDAPGRPWVEFVGNRARRGRLQVVAGLPEALRSMTMIAADTLSTLTIERGRVAGYTWLQAHPRLGDVRDSVFFAYGQDAAPESMDMALYQRDANWRMTQRRVWWSAEAVADSLLETPAKVQPAPADEEDVTLDAPPTLVAIAPGVWCADMPDIDSRSLVVEFADHLALIEIAVGSANGERLLAALRRQWPDKPVRQVFFSHHHPHYAGGLRPFISEGATIFTTPGNEAFVRRMAALPFVAQPDRLARHPHPLELTTFGNRIELADATNQLVALNYGARSQHTDEFVVFWLPRQQLLFETELGWVRRDGQLRPLRRAAGLLSWLDEQKLEVERLVQSYPMRDNEAVVARSTLDSLARPRW